MNRCTPLTTALSRTLSVWLFVMVCSMADSSLAQGIVRHFPESALRASLQVTAPPEILLNGKPARLAPGTRIKGTNNLLVLSGTLVGQALLVNYTKDSQGQLREVWILTPQEAQEKRAGMPQTNIVFGSETEQTKSNNGQ